MFAVEIIQLERFMSATAESNYLFPEQRDWHTFEKFVLDVQLNRFVIFMKRANIHKYFDAF